MWSIINIVIIISSFFLLHCTLSLQITVGPSYDSSVISIKKGFHGINNKNKNENKKLFLTNFRLNGLKNKDVNVNIAPEVVTTVALKKQGPTPREDVIKTIGWVSAAAVFAGFLGIFAGPNYAIEFCTGYLLEQCLSIDNLFVFLILFDYFAVPKSSQDKILNYGIWGAVLLRGIFIGAGAIALEQFHQILLVFAAILLVSSFKILTAKEGEDEEEEDLSNNFVVKLSKKIIPTTDKMDGDNFYSIVDGKTVATPLLLCLICVELSDIVFAFDSVPAIFGVTSNPLIVYSSNIFAIAGLRSLFKVLAGLVEDLKYLEKAVGVVLAVIALKLGFQTFSIEILSPLQSLLLVVAIIGTGVGLSLKDKNTPTNTSK